AVAAHDEEILLLLSGGAEGEPLAVGRNVGGGSFPRPFRDPARLSDGALARRVEPAALEGCALVPLDVAEPAAVSRETEVLAVRGGGRDRLRSTKHLARLLVERDAPEVHRAAAVAREVEVSSVGGPHGIPVEEEVVRHRDGLSAAGRDGPDVALSSSL